MRLKYLATLRNVALSLFSLFLLIARADAAGFDTSYGVYRADFNSGGRANLYIPRPRGPGDHSTRRFRRHRSRTGKEHGPAVEYRLHLYRDFRTHAVAVIDHVVHHRQIAPLMVRHSRPWQTSGSVARCSPSSFAAGEQ